MRGTSIVAVALAVVLILALSLTSAPGKVYNAVLWRCDDGVIDVKYCDALLPPLHFAFESLGDIYRDFDFQYQIRRSAIPKTEYPVLHLYLTDIALGKLKKKREFVLAHEVAPMRFTEPTDWVRGIVISDNGTDRQKIRVRLRLKGTNDDHFIDKKKWSFRIETRNNQLIWGMKNITIHPPGARSYHHEAMIHFMMRSVGVIAPRYFFVDVRINGRVIGTMALEEHVGTEMMENQKRRDGPVVAIDDEWVLRQVFLDDNQNRKNFETRLAIENMDDIGMRGARDWRTVPLAIRDNPIKIYPRGQLLPETARGHNKIRGASLLRDFVNGKIPARSVFDYDLLSRWWIVTQLWHAHHGLSWSDQMFYFNIISGHLEPVSWDNEPKLERDECRHLKRPNLVRSYLCVEMDLFVSLIWNDPVFREILRQNIDEISVLLDSPEFRDRFISEQENHIRALSTEDIAYSANHEINIDRLKQTLLLWAEQVNKLFPAHPSSSYQEIRTVTMFSDSESLSRRQEKLLNISSPLYTHLRPFWFWSADGAEIELKNLTLHPITVHSVFISKEPENSLVPTETTIPVYQKGSNYHVFQSSIDISTFDLGDQMQISYSYRGQQYIKPVIAQFRNYESGYKSQEFTRTWFEKNGVALDQTKQTITFGPGHYSLTTNIEIKKGWLAEFLPGAVLEFKQGARLKVNGPFHALGREDLPVKIVVNSYPERGSLGSWGGLLVLEADRDSILRHTHIVGATTHGFSERQDSYGLTGCITFYKSNVQIEHSRFIGLQCEDALNIISSDFHIDHVEFVGSRADAFDSDFSNGIVNNSTFRDTVNDGIDLSGSQVQVNSSRFFDIQDKAISVGEGSTLDANELTVDGGDAGVVSKDKSAVEIRKSSFKEVNNALMAYVKKDEWGTAEIHCDNCQFDNVEFIAVEQYGSRITVNGKEISPTPFSRKQLQIAGYTQ